MPPINMLIKPASSSCNLKCRYCFYHSLSEKRDIRNYGIMKEETLEAIVRRGLEEAEGFCTFAFQGGEPTLAGLDFFEKLIEFQKKYNKNNIRINNALQTNGTLIDERWAGYLAENKFLVGLSLDGYKDIHDMNRVDITDKGTFNRILKTSALFDKYKVQYNILCVVTKNTAKHGMKVYDFFKKSGFRYIQFIECLDSLDEELGTNKYSLSAEAYGSFLKDIFDRWYEDFRKGEYISIRYFDNLINILLGNRPEACGMMGRCTCEYVIEADGGVYPCDFYVIDKWHMGNIVDKGFEELFYTQQAQDFIKSSVHMDSNCKECRWGSLCMGGCRRHREPFVNGKPSSNYFCLAYRDFFEYAVPGLMDSARRIRSSQRR
jgi:uncharacterized protein